MSENFRHHVATRREIIFVEVPVETPTAGPAYGRPVYPPPFKRNAPTHWQPAHRPPSKRAATADLLRRIAEQEAGLHEFMRQAREQAGRHAG
jgi:hypothetical protein